jgi:D-glycero-D-manno-heptose 1,7-bisphosphate phosphatase
MKLLILDRDGVLNRHTVDAEQGTIDSPMHPSQVVLEAQVPELLARLNAAGYGLCIATNQPAAAKGKTTRANLQAVQARVIELASAKGATILSSHLCLHRAEDGCDCRKPKTGLLREAFVANPTATLAESWMVGDGVTDVEAGRAFGVRTAFIGKRRCDACKILEQSPPDHWGSLAELTAFLERQSRAV